MNATVTTSDNELTESSADWVLRFSVVWLALVVVMVSVGPYLPFVDDPRAFAAGDANEGPTLDHWFGTSRLGSDVFAQVLDGGRVSLRVAAIGTAVGVIVGGWLGLIAGYFRGWVDGIASLMINVALSVPSLVLVTFVVGVRGRSEANVIGAICILAVPAIARVVRASTLQVADREYVKAARALGVKELSILWREIVPNVMPSLVSFAFLTTGIILVVESSLSFLGLSVQPPTITWGSIISEGRIDLGQTPHMVYFPALVLFLTILSLNFVGDRLIDRYNIREAAI